MTQKILAGAIFGGILFCLLSVFVSFWLGYIRQFDYSLAVYQRDLWILGSIFLAILLVPFASGIGAVCGALFMYWRTRRVPKSDV